MAEIDKANNSVRLWDFLLGETCQPNFGFYRWSIIFPEIEIDLKSMHCDNQATNRLHVNCLSPGKVSVKIVSADSEIL